MATKVDALKPALFRIELLHGLLVIALWVVLLPTNLLEPWAFLIGALFMGLNFLLLSCGIRWVLTPFAGKGRIKAGIFLLLLKLTLFLGLLFAFLFRVRLEPLSFMLGVTSLLIAIIWERTWLFVRGQ